MNRVMNCPNCGAATHLNGDTGIATCAYCKTTILPEVAADGVKIVEQTQLVCPGCQALLVQGQLESQDLLYCKSCRGMLIPMNGFMGLVENLRLHRDRPSAALPPMPPDVDLPRLCPYCTSAMENHPYMGPGNIVIDTCSGCEVNWLDKGKLQRVVSAPDHRPVYSSYDSAGQQDEPQAPFLDNLLHF